MKQRYRHTLIASYIGYMVQALVINFPPLLFVTFREVFGISVGKISLLISVNFLVQLTVDLLSAKYVGKIGFKRGAVLAHVLAFAGLFLLGFLPYVTDAFTGILTATVLMAAGGGLTEVIISPIVQSLPLKHKASQMSILHSFFCWGFMLTVLVSTLFFVTAGIGLWHLLCVLWSLLPFINIFLFASAPMYVTDQNEQAGTEKGIIFKPFFILMLVFMLCGGASEMALSQWASFFAETSLSISKTAGDLLGPCSFALLMGTARIIFAKNEKRINLRLALMLSALLCVISYALAALSPLPILSLAGCTLCGLSVGLMWPGVLSLSAEKFPKGGGQMFALLAFAGDLGCVLGPFLLGIISDFTGNLKTGLLFVIIFPAILFIGLIKNFNRQEIDKNVR